jgi:hypothetical protein
MAPVQLMSGVISSIPVLKLSINSKSTTTYPVPATLEESTTILVRTVSLICCWAGGTLQAKGPYPTSL